MGQTKLGEKDRELEAASAGLYRGHSGQHSRDFVHGADDGCQELVSHGPHVSDGVV